MYRSQVVAARHLQELGTAPVQLGDSHAARQRPTCGRIARKGAGQPQRQLPVSASAHVKRLCALSEAADRQSALRGQCSQCERWPRCESLRKRKSDSTPSRHCGFELGRRERRCNILPEENQHSFPLTIPRNSKFKAKRHSWGRPPLHGPCGVRVFVFLSYGKAHFSGKAK